MNYGQLQQQNRPYSQPSPQLQSSSGGKNFKNNNIEIVQIKKF